MLVPRIWKNDLFSDSVDYMFENMFDMPKLWEGNRKLMSTDVKDLGNSYQLMMELPGFEKENIQADLYDGTLTVTAERKNEIEEKDENKNFVHRERYLGTLKRSFQVEKYLTTEDIKASFENGILTLTLPKKEQAQLEQKKSIMIE